MAGSGVSTCTVPSTAVPVLLDFAQRFVGVHRAVALDQRAGLGGVAPLAQQEHHLRASRPARARGSSGARRTGSRPAPVFPDSSSPRSSDAGWSRLAFRPRNSRRSPVQEVWQSAQVGERDPVCELPVPRVAREQRSGDGVELGDHVGRRSAPRDSEHPLGIGRHREAPLAARLILEVRRESLMESRTGTSCRSVEGDAVRGVLEAAVALAVPDDVGPGLLANRQERRPPDEAGVLVAHVERLARGVADGIVRPGRELVLAAVDGPGGARARLRDLEAELRVRDHVEPGRRGPLPCAEHRDVLAAVRRESADAVRELRGRARAAQRLRLARAACAGAAAPARAGAPRAEPAAPTASPGSRAARHAPPRRAGSGRARSTRSARSRNTPPRCHGCTCPAAWLARTMSSKDSWSPWA